MSLLSSPSQLSWQKALKNAVRDPVRLLEALELTPSEYPWITSKPFGLLVPWGFIHRMEKGNPSDPLLQQVLPVEQENQIHPSFPPHPLQEHRFMPLAGLIHKFKSRVLWVVSGGCAVHCRYCFRRHFPYHAQSLTRANWPMALEYIAQDPHIFEVILSGGDPLSLSDPMLQALCQQIAQLKQVQTLRIHSRFLVMLPERLTSDLKRLFAALPLNIVMVIHCNHAHEIDASVKASIQTLKACGVTVLNQAVLLKGINDSLLAQKNLSLALFDAGVLPYYLNFLDPVQGAHHFHVSKQQAQLLLEQLMHELPGYLVPKLVQEIPGHPYKMPMAPLLPTE